MSKDTLHIPGDAALEYAIPTNVDGMLKAYCVLYEADTTSMGDDCVHGFVPNALLPLLELTPVVQCADHGAWEGYDILRPKMQYSAAEQYSMHPELSHLEPK